MNVLFLSPSFPAYNMGFARQLMEHGAQVLCIGDAEYDDFSAGEKSSFTEYYHVSSLEDYDTVYRGTAFFIHKYGRIDRVVSLNAYWQSLASELRRDYGIEGAKESKPLIDANYDVSYEALIDEDGYPVLEMSRVFRGVDGSYTLSEVSRTLRNAASKAIASLDVRADFVTVEMKKVGAGYSVVNAYSAPLAFAPDIFNYAFAFDVYSAWAYLVTGGKIEAAVQKQNVTMLRTVEGHAYSSVSPEYFSSLESKMLQESAASIAYAWAGNDTVFIVGADSEDEARGILSVFVGAELPRFIAPRAARKSAAERLAEASDSMPDKKVVAEAVEKPVERPDVSKKSIYIKPVSKSRSKVRTTAPAAKDSDIPSLATASISQGSIADVSDSVVKPSDIALDSENKK